MECCCMRDVLSAAVLSAVVVGGAVWRGVSGISVRLVESGRLTWGTDGWVLLLWWETVFWL